MLLVFNPKTSDVVKKLSRSLYKKKNIYMILKMLLHICHADNLNGDFVSLWT